MPPTGGRLSPRRRLQVAFDKLGPRVPLDQLSIEIGDTRRATALYLRINAKRDGYQRVGPRRRHVLPTWERIPNETTTPTLTEATA